MPIITSTKTCFSLKPFNVELNNHIFDSKSKTTREMKDDKNIYKIQDKKGLMFFKNEKISSNVLNVINKHL